MSQIDYEIDLRFSEVRYRVRFSKEHGHILDLAVQIECKEEESWTPVVRYDTAHGFFHRDRYSHDGTVNRHERIELADYESALTFAVRDIKDNWEDWL